MNDRIILPAQEWLGYDPERGDIHGYTPEQMHWLADRIVRECIDKITTYDLVPGHSAKWEDIYDIHTRLLQDLGAELKEHFGVGE